MVVFFLLVGVLWSGLGRVFLLFAVWVVWFVLGDLVDVRGVGGCGAFCFCFSLRLYDHPHRPSLCCLELLFSFLPSSSTYLKDRGDMALKSLSLPLSGSLGEVNSCLRLVNVAHAHLMRWSNSNLDCVLKVLSRPRYLMFRSGGRISMFIPCCHLVVVLFFSLLSVRMSPQCLALARPSSAMLKCVECLFDTMAATQSGWCQLAALCLSFFNSAGLYWRTHPNCVLFLLRLTRLRLLHIHQNIPL